MNVSVWWIVSWAYASPIDVVGYGTNTAQGNTGTASVGIDALSLNPAGITGKRSISFGYSMLRTHFVDVPSVAWDSNQDGTINEYDERLQPNVNYAPADGVSLAIVQPMIDGITFGFNAYLPSAHLLRLNTYDSALPSYFLYRSALQRYGILAGVSYAVSDDLRIGVGIDLLYTAHFQLMGTLRGVASEGEDGEAHLETYVDLHDISLEANPAASYTLGCQWSPYFVEGLRVGAAFRTAQANVMDVYLDFQADGTLTGLDNFNDQNTTILLPLSLSLLDYYKPAEFRMGLAWEKWKRAQLYGDIVWTGWSKAFLNTIQVKEGSLSIPMLYDEPIAVLDGNPYQLELQDVWSFRLGLASHWMLGSVPVVFRGGIGSISSALSRYGRNMSPLEAPRLLFSSGITIEVTSPILEKPMLISLMGQWQKLATGYIEVLYDTPQTLGAPEGDTVPFGGSLLNASLQTQVYY